jgi:hypothetical protein
MIEFVCPGCTKSYEANRAFIGFETRCLRCGTVVQIPRRSGATPAASTLTTMAAKGNGLVASRKTVLNAKPTRAHERIETGMNSVTPTATLSPPRRRPMQAQKAPLEPELPIPSLPEQAAVEGPFTDVIRKRKRKQWIIGGSAGGALLVAVLIIAFSGGKAPKPVAKADPPPPRKEEPKPEPPPKPPQAAPTYEPAPLPRVVRPAVEAELTAAALLLEYGEGPPNCDLKYAGKDLLIRGVFQNHRLGKLTLVPSDEKSTPLHFSLLPPADPNEFLAEPNLLSGQAVSIRGTYRAGCRFTEATIEPGEARADRFYLNKPVCLEGAIIRSVNAPTGAVPFPTLTLEPFFTDSKLNVTCFFKSSDLNDVIRLKPGARVNVIGRCAGRSFTSVRIDNCAIANPDEPPGAETIRIPSDVFFTEYEADLLPFARVNMKEPSIELLPVTAEGLGHAYQFDPRSANLQYRNKAVQVSGTVKERHANARMIVLQCGTETTFSVSVVFSQAAFAQVPEDRNIVVKGVCSGLSGGYVRIDCGEYAETDGLKALRTEVEYLPYRLGKEHIVDQIVPGRGKTSPIRRLAVRFAGDDLIQVALLKAGTLSGATLLQDPLPEVKWSSTSLAKQPPQVRRYRIRDGVVEIGQPFMATEKREVQEFWEPVLKAGMKRGQFWSVRFPDGKLATYTVMGFSKDEAGIDRLEIKRTLRDLNDPTRWEETAVTYLHGIGEVRRIVTNRTERGEAAVLGESRFVTDGLPREPRTPELKRETRP